MLVQPLKLTAARELQKISRRANLARHPPRAIRTPEITAVVLKTCIKNSLNSIALPKVRGQQRRMNLVGHKTDPSQLLKTEGKTDMRTGGGLINFPCLMLKVD